MPPDQPRQRRKPLTIPQLVEEIDGVEWLTFVYTAKGQSTPYTIRIDTGSVSIDELTVEFKTANSVYPRAYLERSEYKGNRWDYETTVNDFGWQLCYLNQDILVGKRGLLQRAVDRYFLYLYSYRNRFPAMQSRRVARVKKVPPAAKHKTKAPKPKPAETKKMKSAHAMKRAEQISFYNVANLPHWMSVNTVRNSSSFELHVRVDVTSIDISLISEEVRSLYSVFPSSPKGLPLTPRQVRCNELACKLALLNPTTLKGQPTLLQRALDVYIVQFEIVDMWPARRIRQLQLSSF